MRTAEVAAWVNEREAIRLRKAVLESRGITCEEPWPDNEGAWGKGYWTLDHLTDDPILHKFRFCNVRREDDRVTTWIRQNIIERWADHEHLWLMLAIARTINWPPTLQELIDGEEVPSWPSYKEFKPLWLSDALEKRKERGDKVYTGSYMIRAASSPSEPYFTWSKQQYIAKIVIGRLWEARHDWQHFGMNPVDRSSQGVWEYFQLFIGWGPFMAYQVVVDLQHTRYLRDAPDIQTWAAAGPGTLRGLLRWQGFPVTDILNQPSALGLLLHLREELNTPGVLPPWVGTLDLSDVCNICCEFDKHERVRLGEGRPRALYVPGRGH